MLGVEVAVIVALPVGVMLFVEVLLIPPDVTSYMFRRLGPPQNSVALPLQIMLHCVTFGVVPPTSTEPALMVLPQKPFRLANSLSSRLLADLHSPEYSTPK